MTRTPLAPSIAAAIACCICICSMNAAAAGVSDEVQQNADDAELDPAKLYERGLKLAEQGKFVDATSAFKRAYELRPHARVLYNLGQASIGLGHYAQALAYLRQYLADSNNDATPARRAAVEQQMQDLAAATASVALEVIPAGSEVFVDQQKVGTSPLAAPLILDPGMHHVTAKHEGFLPSTASLSVRAGDSQPLSLALLPMPKEQLAPHVGLLTVSCRASDVAVSVDGRVLFRSPGESSLALEEGRHEIVFGRHAHAPTKQHVEIQSLVTTSVACPWAAPAPQQQSLDVTEVPRHRRVGPVSYALWLAAGGLLAGAGTVALWNQQRRDEWRREDQELERRFADNPNADLQAPQDRNDRLAASINKATTWTWVMAAGAGACALTGTAFYVFGARVEVGPAPRIALRLDW